MLNKEFLLPISNKRVPSIYDEFHFAVKMRADENEHYVWNYSEDLKNVVGGRIPWWVNPNNFLKKIDLYSWTFIYQSNAPVDVIAKSALPNIHGCELSGHIYATITMFVPLPLISFKSDNSLNVRFINYIKEHDILCLKFSGTYTDEQGQEKSYAPTDYLYL